MFIISPSIINVWILSWRNSLVTSSKPKDFLFLYRNYQGLLDCSFLDRRQRGPIRSVLLVKIGWLVGNAVFSETALRIFLIFCIKLGDYKGRKVTEPDFWKKFLIRKYSQKGLQISPKSDTLIFFSKTTLTVFLVFGLKLVLNIIFNLSETYFLKKKNTIWKYLTSKSSKNCPDWGFWPFSQFCSISFPWFSI